MHRFARSWLPFAAAALAVLVVLPGLAQTTDAATSKWTSNCSTNLRTSPRTSASVKKVAVAGTIVTASATVTGGSWSADCKTFVKGSSWLKIVAVNGRSTSSLFGVSAVYAAKGLFKSGPNPTAVPTAKPTAVPTAKPTVAPTPKPAPTTTNYLSNCSVRLRTSTSIAAGTKSIIDTNSVVTAASKVSGGSWKADCKTSVSGSSWYKITAVGGKSVSSLYGVSAVYAATGLFRSVTASSGYKEGIDVSHWQGNIDWSRVKASGRTFAIAKATEGVGFRDSAYTRNKAGAMGQGLKFGAYHFAQPANDPIKEADWFVNNAGYQRGMLVPTLDLERTGGRGPTALTNWVKAWVSRVDARLGVKPMIYMSPAFWRTNLNDTRWFADNGYGILWVAHWGVSSPSVPASNWGGRSWTFWQYTSSGTVPGISGRVDLNRYRFASFDAVTY
jgi:GH25 family lysozyme M1 (1,4-beta-N-acetylmuramidase)